MPNSPTHLGTIRCQIAAARRQLDALEAACLRFEDDSLGTAAPSTANLTGANAAVITATSAITAAIAAI